MTLLTYQVFKTVADIGSFHKAADILGLTPSAVSHTITNMEKELGFTVLSRSKSGISLTNYGEKILPYINAVLNINIKTYNPGKKLLVSVSYISYGIIYIIAKNSLASPADHILK